jgi:hypothetical protein
MYQHRVYQLDLCVCTVSRPGDTALQSKLREELNSTGTSRRRRFATWQVEAQSPAWPALLSYLVTCARRGSFWQGETSHISLVRFLILCLKSGQFRCNNPDDLSPQAIRISEGLFR